MKENRIIARITRDALTHGINTSVITDIVEKFIAKNYPDIGEYKFFERSIPTHLKGPIKYSDNGLLGYFLEKDENNNDIIKLCQVEIYQYYLSLDGKNFISKHKLYDLNGFFFTVVIGIELDKSFNPIYSNELFHTMFIKSAIEVSEELESEANEEWEESISLNNNVCVSLIPEPRILYQTLLNNKNQK